MVVIEDLNTRVGNGVFEGIVGQHAVPGRNKKWRTITGDVCRAGVSGE